jgi:prepilin signal peptidase PulO-like enzyme (type II secretory pathway)
LDNSWALMLAVVAGLLGLIFGSAINAMVWRLYVGRSWTRGRSECPECGHKLAVKDLVPVVSWVMLRGKCRYCKKPIKDHPAVELVTALAFALSAYVLAPSLVGGVTGAMEWVRLGLWLVMLVMLIVLAVYDLRWLLLPDKVMVPLILVALVYAGAMAGLSQWAGQAEAWRVLVGALLAGVAVGGAFYALVLFSKGRAMGGGDIKLAFAMGLMLGVKGVAVAMLLAFNAAAIVGIVMIATKRRGRKDQIPFGPFLVGGTVVAFLFGRILIDWYLRMNRMV